MAGFLAAMANPGIPDGSQGDFTTYAKMADNFAQQVDTSWAAQGLGVPTGFQDDLILTAAEELWSRRSPLENSLAFNPKNYTGAAAEVIAKAVAGNAQVVAEGVNPSACGGGSSNVAAASITLFTTSVGHEFSTSGVNTHLVDVNPNPFSAAIGASVYVAAYATGEGGTLGSLDILDNNAGTSILTAPVAITNNSPSVISSATLKAPFAVGGSYTVRVSGFSGQTLSVQSVWIL
jgi:hypothetical protein